VVRSLRELLRNFFKLRAEHVHSPVAHLVRRLLAKAFGVALREGWWTKAVEPASLFPACMKVAAFTLR
jgi:hypothetical protein